MARAYYFAKITEFLEHDPDQILGLLARHHQFAVEELQKSAWLGQISILKHSLGAHTDGHILLEYSIPRMGKRVDAILLIAGIVILLEFKVGDSQYSAHALDQALDYALDLKNFHQQSHNLPIVPIVVATEAPAMPTSLAAFEDRVYEPVKANRHNLSQVIGTVTQAITAPDLEPLVWCDSAYRPTPTIIEAAQALYQNHSVEDISRSDAGATNLSLTSAAIFSIIDATKARGQKAICFVTGVPGAGKTLAGLNIATQRLRTAADEHAVFLSGNGPLVDVLREALARNEQATSSVRMSAARTRVKTFIQNIHHFRDDALNSNKAPTEKVAVFDEAQRAWTLKETAAFMAKKRGTVNFGMSEPHFLISVMDRHTDWAVIVCLVGGGQEINRGEAGLMEWLASLRNAFPDWQVYVSPNLSAAEYTDGASIKDLIPAQRLHIDPRLHLAVSLRSFRAETVSDLIKAILDNEFETAQALRATLDRRYPFVITRDIALAREWLQSKARGSERFGLLASSGAHRLRPMGVHVRANVDVINWFLNGKDDVRSSYYLEEVATEFDVQGLELDWAGVVWDADLRYVNGRWDHRAFRGTAWGRVNDATRMRYLKNAYRVLLTRARQGVVIVVPHGSQADPTRKPEYYDGTYQFLKQIGFENL
jgi:hypothetical protein